MTAIERAVDAALRKLAEQHGEPVAGPEDEDHLSKLVSVIAPTVEAAVPEICICAAVRLMDGLVVRGHRHHDCLRAAGEMKRIPLGAAQGFITSRGRFVDRREAMQLQLAAGIVSADEGGYRGDGLFSEDLY